MVEAENGPAALALWTQHDGEFDLIFADPPYAKNAGDPDHAAALAQSEKLAGALAPGGVFVLERQSGGKPPASLLQAGRTKRYGGSEILTFFKA